jgi:hypothetical protein
MAGTVTVPAGAFLHFRHAHHQEFASTPSLVYYDGGILEYSTNNGATWVDIAPLYSAGENYGGAISAVDGSPIAGRNAFVGSSHGYVSTRYSLASLAGSTVRLRFRNASDLFVASTRAWYIDEVRVYTCAVDTSPNNAPSANAGPDIAAGAGRPVSVDGSGSFDSDGFIASSTWTQVSGPVVAMTRTGISISFTAPPSPVQDTLVFRLAVTDNRGVTSSDDVIVTSTNVQPVSNAGADQSLKPRANATLAGSATDADGTIATYAWTQVSGPTVTLTGAATTTLSFVAPSVPISSNLVFRLTARDNFGGLGFDDVVVQVNNAQPIVTIGGTQSVAAGAGVTLAGSAVDSDGTITSYVWTQTGGGPVSLTGTTGNTSSFAAPSASSSSTLTFRLTATDNDGGIGAADVIVVVQAAPQPGKSGGGGLDPYTLIGLLTLAGFALRTRWRLHS